MLDVDPRNDGEVGFASLCHDLGLDSTKWPRVITGSGGWHCYLRKPADVKICDTLEDYPGVEFKSIGRQVVAAGSRHPNGKFYKWSPDYPSIRAGLPMVPHLLLQAIRRPIYLPREDGDGGVYGTDQLALMLAALDVEAFRSHEDWLQLMFACHHATAGDGEDVFVRWSTSDPNYDDHDEVIAARWRSCGTSKSDLVTYRTLNMILRKHGAGHLVPVPDDEFPAVVQARRLGKVTPPRVIGKVKP